MKNGKGYSAVSNASDDDQSSNDEPVHHALHQPQLFSKLRFFWSWVFHLSFFVINVIGFVFLRRSSIDLGRCVEETSWWSPAVQSVKANFENVRFAGLREASSPWRGEPRPELEAAWNSVTWEMGEISTTLDDARRAGIELDLNSLVRFPTNDGGDVYTSVEWVHHLHCLNQLRKFTRYNYYKDKDISFLQPFGETVNHMDHCIDMLRQRVMCTPDTGLIFSHWVKGHDHKHVNFNTQHRCMNFQNAVDWVKERSKLVNMSDLVRHEGAVDLPDFPENLTVHTNGYKGSMWYQQ